MKLGTLCYVRNGSQTLMMYRESKDHAHVGKWNGLGGKMERGETPEESVIRELKEESGLEIRPTLRGRVIFPAFEVQPEDWHVYIFTADDFSGELSQSSEGRLEWVNDKDLLKLSLWEGDKYIFEWIRSEAFFSGKLVYNSDGVLIETKVNFYD